ncbi:MAG: sulfur carrier protein ThiS [Candidatus Eisenbacteria bacterium]|nr:sulfur carrier protein ThiS [Candidatus Eisenbacteria bacterium]
MAEITVNGERRPVGGPLPLLRLLAEMEIGPRWVLVERNGEPVPRDRYEVTVVEPGDRLEIATPMGGG